MAVNIGPYQNIVNVGWGTGLLGVLTIFFGPSVPGVGESNFRQAVAVLDLPELEDLGFLISSWDASGAKADPATELWTGPGEALSPESVALPPHIVHAFRRMTATAINQPIVIGDDTNPYNGNLWTNDATVGGVIVSRPGGYWTVFLNMVRIRSALPDGEADAVLNLFIDQASAGNTAGDVDADLTFRTYQKTRIDDFSIDAAGFLTFTGPSENLIHTASPITVTAAISSTGPQAKLNFNTLTGVGSLVEV